MIFDSLYSLIAPPVCPLCDRVLRRGEPELCPACIANLPKTQEAFHRGNRVEQLFDDDIKCIRGAAWCYYRPCHPIRRMVHEMKFGGKPELAILIGKKIGEEWRDSGFFNDIDLLVPIPLHRKRLVERGYNQAELMARGISEATGIPIDTYHLVRKKNNRHQSQLSLLERLEMADVFGINKPEELRNKHILLIDDVITSGSTMRRAMKVLHAIPKCTYSVLALAIASK